MGIIELHEGALDQAGQIVEGIGSSHQELPTPCTDWNVEALLNHIIGTNWMFASFAEGKQFSEEETTTPAMTSGNGSNSHPAEAYRRSADALKRAWREPGRIEQGYQLPFGELPGEAVLGIHTMELVQHGWDLARATGQEAHYDPAVVAVAGDRQRVQSKGKSTACSTRSPREMNGSQPGSSFLIRRKSLPGNARS
jgi:uncharacterized protein (TIGR03086 family)